MSDRVAASDDWRQQGESSSSSKWIAVTWLTLFTVGLIAFFVWLLWPESVPTGVMVVVSPGFYDPDVDGIPYAAESHERFDESSVPMQLRTQVIRSNSELETLGTNLEIDGVEPEITCLLLSLHGVSKIVDDGETTQTQPVLLASNFRFDQRTAGSSASRSPFVDSPQAVDVVRLIQDLQNLKSETKVLMLDTSYLQTDIPFGMGVNEFPFLVEQVVAELQDSGLWVILSTGLLNPASSQHLEGSQGSVFVNAVQATMLELGDKNGISEADEVSLLTFYQRVTQHCLSATNNRQRPVLLRGSVGLVGAKAAEADLDAAAATTMFLPSLDIPEPEDEESEDQVAQRFPRLNGIAESAFESIYEPVVERSRDVAGRWPPANNLPALMSLSPSFVNRTFGWQDDQDDTAQAAADPAAADQDDTSGDDTSSDDATDEDDSSETGGDSSEETQDAEVEPTAQELRRDRLDQFLAEFEQGQINQLELRLFEIKLLLERLHHRDNPGRWSPVDFAPDEWNRLLREIGRLVERAYHIRPQSDEFEIRLQRANVIHRQLLELQTHFDEPSRSVPAANQSRLMSAFQQIDDEIRETWGAPSSASEAAIIRSIRTYHDVLFRIRGFVELHMELSSVSEADFAAAIEALLGQIDRHQETFESKAEFGDEQFGLEDDITALTSAASALRQEERRLYISVLAEIGDTVANLEKENDIGAALDVMMKASKSHLIPLFGLYGEDTADQGGALRSFALMYDRCQDLRTRELPDVPAISRYKAPSDDSYFYGSAAAWGKAVRRLELQSEVNRYLLGTPQSAALVELRQRVNDIPSDASLDADRVRELLQLVRAATIELADTEHKIIRAEVVGHASSLLEHAWQRRIASVVDWRVGGLFAPDHLPDLRFLEAPEPVSVSVAATEPLLRMTQPKQTFTFAVQANVGYRQRYGLNPLPVLVTDASTDLFQFRYLNGPNGPQVVRPGDRLEAVIDIEGNGLLEFEVESLFDMAEARQQGLVAYSENQASFEVEIVDVDVDQRVELDNQGNPISNVDPLSTSLNVDPYQPLHVDLIVQNKLTRLWEPSSPLDGRTSWERDDSFPSAKPIEAIRIQDVPGVASNFDLLLVNRSAIDVTATVELYAVERHNLREPVRAFPLAVLPGRVSASGQTRPRPALRDHMVGRLEGRVNDLNNQRTSPVPLATSLPVELPFRREVAPDEAATFAEGGLARLVDFSPDPNAESPPTPAPTDVSRGILAKISIEGWPGGTVTQYNWIEFDLLQPEDFLNVGEFGDGNAPEIRYDVDREVVSWNLGVEFQPAPWVAKEIDPWLVFNALTVAWKNGDDPRFPFQILGKEEMEATAGAPTGAMSWRAIDQFGDNDRFRFYLDVNGYPRALGYEVNVDRGGSGSYIRSQAGRRESEVRILSLETLPADEQVPPLLGYELQEDEVWWFGSIDGIKITYAIDGPLANLLRLFPDDLSQEEYIDLFVEPGGRERRYFDREIRRTALVDKNGMSISTDVSDLTFTLDSMAYNTPTRIGATLSLVGTQETVERLVGVDTNPPRIVRFSFADPELENRDRVRIAADKEVRLLVEVADGESGVARQDVRLFANPGLTRRNRWDYEAETIADITGSGPDPDGVRVDGDRYTFEIVLPAKDLKQATNTIIPLVYDRVENVGEMPSREAEQRENLRPLVVDVYEPSEDDPGPGDGTDEPDLPESYEIRIELLGPADTVLRENSKIQSVTIGDDAAAYELVDGGGFVIKDLQPGSYVIGATYRSSTGSLMTGSTTIVIAEDREASVVAGQVKVR